MTKKKDPADLKKRGRPTAYNEDIALEICARLADGESVNKISQSKNMPARSTIIKWLSDFPEFSVMYARARDIGMDCRFDEIIDIADNVDNVDKDKCRRAQLMIDTRKWYLAKFAPRKYGDRVTKVVVGDKGADPVQTEITGDVNMTIEDYRTARREMLEEDDC